MLLSIFQSELDSACLIGALKFDLVKLFKKNSRYSSHFGFLSTVRTLLLSKMPLVDAGSTEKPVTLTACDGLLNYVLAN